MRDLIWRAPLYFYPKNQMLSLFMVKNDFLNNFFNKLIINNY